MKTYVLEMQYFMVIKSKWAELDYSCRQEVHT